MKTRWIVLLPLLLALNVHSQPVNGEYNWQFVGLDLPVFDLKESLLLGDMGGIDQEIRVELLPSGRISGTYEGSYDDWGIGINIAGTLNGRISSKGSSLKVQIAGRGPVSGSVYEEPISGNANFSVSLLADTSLGEAYMMQRVSVCLARYGCETERQIESFQIEEALSGGGDWSLNLNVTNENNTINGIARATLISGRTAEFQVRGKHAANTGLSKLQLRGIGTAKGANLQVTADSAMNCKTVRGKLFGQTLIKSY